jgi:hypothetical protein
MNRDDAPSGDVAGIPVPATANPPRQPRSPRPYEAPRLERLGEWSALTLQQSIPIGPGNW